MSCRCDMLCCAVQLFCVVLAFVVSEEANIASTDEIKIRHHDNVDTNLGYLEAHSTAEQIDPPPIYSQHEFVLSYRGVAD